MSTTHVSHPTDAPARVDRARGALLGAALGDAMGMPGELWPRDRVRAHFGWIDRFLPGPDGHVIVDGFAAGQITDDTQQTLMLARAILDGGGDVDPRLVARHLVAWADEVGASEGHFLGPTSAAAIEALRRGADPTTTGVPDATGTGGQTNGAAMRVAPVGVVRRPSDLEALVDAVEASCVVSHHTSVGVSGAALVAGVVSAALELPAGRATADGVGAVLEVGLAAAAVGEGRGVQVIAPSIPARAAWAADLAREGGDDVAFLGRLYDLVGAGVTMGETVPAAAGLLVRSGGDPVRCATLAANLGGDTDTIGAIATAMAGAVAGASAVPRELVDQLTSVNDLPYAALADRLLAVRR